MSLMQNERTKLSATYLNGIAIAIIAVGGFAPLVARVSMGEAPSLSVAILCVTCILISATLHYAARYVLKGLQL